MSTWQSTALHFAGDHPAGAGHFPGDPMIPGALLLDLVVAVIGGGGAVSLRAAKFLHVVRPGDALDLRWRTVEGGAVAVECRLENDVVAMTGIFELGGAA